MKCDWPRIRLPFSGISSGTSFSSIGNHNGSSCRASGSRAAMSRHSVTTRHNGFMAPLTFAEARARVIAEVRGARKTPATEEAELDRAAGRVLAEAVAADRDSPAVARSVRDGYAVRAADLPGELRIIGEVRAGERFTGTVGVGQAVEIMTGAPIPAGADAVVMLEHTRRVNGRMQTDRSAEPNQFIQDRKSPR